jgi:LmbE family N-acetylglucosaminyl deacetylase
LARGGATIEVVAVTDGEGSHPGSRSITPARLGRVRTTEAESALCRLGLGPVDRLRLRLSDGQVSTREDELADRLTGLLDGDCLCLATWREDGHPDHEAVGRAASVAASRRGARLVEYPVWAWHWARPDDPDPAAFPWARARVHALDEVGRQAKASAIHAFVSQITPVGPDPADRAVLPDAVLQRFRRPFEVVFDA